MFSHHLSSHEANELSAWLRLSLTDGVGNETARQWLAAYGLPQAIFEADPGALRGPAIERLRRAIETVPEALPALLACTLDWRAGRRRAPLCARAARTICTWPLAYSFASWTRPRCA
jgi:predicted Rossmann fold nucleotide-binding protein DprA/Smf involved in DNA uptake